MKHCADKEIKKAKKEIPKKKFVELAMMKSVRN